MFCIGCFFFLFFKQKTAYEMRISDWSSDVCSSDRCYGDLDVESSYGEAGDGEEGTDFPGMGFEGAEVTAAAGTAVMFVEIYYDYQPLLYGKVVGQRRSEEHTSELQSLMRISYAVFCLKKKTIIQRRQQLTII